MAVTAGDIAIAVAELAALEAISPPPTNLCTLVATALSVQMMALAVEQQAVLAAAQAQVLVQNAIAFAANPQAAIQYGVKKAEAEAQALLDLAYNEAMASIARLCPLNVPGF